MGTASLMVVNGWSMATNLYKLVFRVGTVNFRSTGADGPKPHECRLGRSGPCPQRRIRGTVVAKERT